MTSAEHPDDGRRPAAASSQLRSEEKLAQTASPEIHKQKKEAVRDTDDTLSAKSNGSDPTDAEQQSPQLQRRLKSRHLQMIAIGMSRKKVRVAVVNGR